MASPVGHTRVLERLYGAATRSVRWEACLRALAARFRGEGAVLVDAEKGREPPRLVAGYGIDTRLLQRIAQLTTDDVLTERALRRGSGEPIACRMLLSDQEVHGSELYRELMAPAGFEYRLNIKSSRSPSRFRCITVFRCPEAGPFDESDVVCASKLAPHIDRAVDLYATFSRLATERAAALSTLDDFGIGIGLADEGGIIRFLNGEARRILSLDDGLTIIDDRLHCSDPIANRRLRSNVEQACKALAADDIVEGCPVRVERKSGAAPFAVFVIAARDYEELLDPGEAESAFATILVSNPQRRIALSQIALRNLYGITRAEAKVLEGILAGATVTELAEQLKVTPGTVRAHLKGIFKATRTRSQADLVRRVMLDAGWMRAPPPP